MRLSFRLLTTAMILCGLGLSAGCGEKKVETVPPEKAMQVGPVSAPSKGAGMAGNPAKP